MSTKLIGCVRCLFLRWPLLQCPVPHFFLSCASRTGRRSPQFPLLSPAPLALIFLCHTAAPLPQRRHTNAHTQASFVSCATITERKGEGECTRHHCWWSKKLLVYCPVLWWIFLEHLNGLGLMLFVFTVRRIATSPLLEGLWYWLYCFTSLIQLLFRGHDWHMPQKSHTENTTTSMQSDSQRLRKDAERHRKYYSSETTEQRRRRLERDAIRHRMAYHEKKIKRWVVNHQWILFCNLLRLKLLQITTENDSRPKINKTLIAKSTPKYWCNKQWVFVIIIWDRWPENKEYKFQ